MSEVVLLKLSAGSGDRCSFT